MSDPVITQLADQTRAVLAQHLRWAVDRVRLNYGWLTPIDLPRDLPPRRLRREPAPTPTPGLVLVLCGCDGTTHFHAAIDPEALP